MIPNAQRFHGVTAWEIVFGSQGSEKQLAHCNSPRRKVVEPVDIPPSKREGIRHAFTAESLRCIGADEVDRLRMLLASGMPAEIDIGGKDLYEWAKEMDAIQCQALLRPSDVAYHDDSNTAKEKEIAQLHGSFVLDRRETEDSIHHLTNRLDELESLGNALSISLDGLAEEISVCNGLLLMGGGASALASHVRSLKSTKERKMDELTRIEESWENSEDELAYWVKEGGAEAVKIAESMQPTHRLARRASLPLPTTDEEAESQKVQLKAQIAATEVKIRKLRASIQDLSEACARELEEVDKRGLLGGINMVRGLREEIRDLDFVLSEAKNGEATCRTKISLIQSKIDANRKSALKAHESSSNASELGSTNMSSAKDVAKSNGTMESVDSSVEQETKDSERLATGQSTAIALRNPGLQGFFPLSLWEIILRIIGLRDERPRAAPEIMVL
jgi:hypothetical protein